MGRKLSEKEKEVYIKNRDELHAQLSELQADLEEISGEELVECRSVMLERVNNCLAAILETDEDNLETEEISGALDSKTIKKLQKYAFRNCDHVLSIVQTSDDKFCIRPVRWAARFHGAKMLEGEYLAIFNTKEEAVDAMVEYCGYSRSYALSMAR